MNFSGSSPLRDICEISSDAALEDLLEDSNISSLLKKFLEIGVTADVLWDVTDDILHNGGFTEIEIIRYNNARKAKEEQAIKGKGKFKTP